MATVTTGADSLGTLPQATRRDFSGVDYDEAMRRARAIVPTLRERAQRHLRDVLAINQQFSFNFDIAGAAYGLLALGGTYASPTM